MKGEAMDTNALLNGVDLFGEAIVKGATNIIAQRFGASPFSVLDARGGEWQDRKRAWISIGIKGELGRAGVKTYNIGDKREWEKRLLLTTECGNDYYRDKKKKEEEIGRILAHDEFQEKYYDESRPYDKGLSIFDPTLCELAYKWFCPEGGIVVDPFAGGSVRGIVAGCLGRKYWGCDLSGKQVEENEKQKAEIIPDGDITWINGDSNEKIKEAPEADFMFSCPPYGDLETYSDDPRDLSNMEYDKFLEAYQSIIKGTCGRLKINRFACFVVGDFRDKKGYCRGFVADTINGFRKADMEFYNDAILATAVGSAAMRVTKQFNAGRKSCKTHQNVLVFCKGDWRKAAQACNEKEEAK